MHTDDAVQRFEDDAASSDEELLLRLRDGDQRAYVALWKRHIDASLRVAQRLSPTRADDLVSEAFLAVYQQVTTTSKGPRSAFRAYLFTVMRNTAIRWSKESGRVDTVPELELADVEDGLQLLERDADAAELFAAFQELPDRWQRVLWLAEVDEVPRPRIAAELGVEPNAVSSLQRRARAGLRLQWLVQKVPQNLREDPSHVADRLPRFLLGQIEGEGALQVESHVTHCGICTDLLEELRSLTARMRGTRILTRGFAALAVVLPAASPPHGAAVAGGAAIAAGAATVVGISSGAALSGISAILVAGLIAAALLIGVPARTTGEHDVATDTGTSSTASDENSDDQTRETQISDDEEVEQSNSDGVIRTGRHNTDPSISVIDFSRDSSFSLPVLPTTPQPEEPGTVPDPVAEGTGLVVSLETPSVYSDYVAPVLAGNTIPGAEVAVEILENRYLADVDDDGVWSFDLRPFDRIAGTYEYTVWAYTDTEQSTAETGNYTLLPTEVQGFEDNPTIDISEAVDTGIVMTVRGPADGTVCLDSMAGQSATIDLDAAGESTLRLRMHSHGFYVFNFRACADGYRGANTECFVTVLDDSILFDPWGPDPADMTFEITEV